MNELENKKKQAIKDVLHAVRKQISKDGIVAGEMHFEKIKYIEKDENGTIIVSYPMEKGTFHNYCSIKIEPNGKTNIDGVQTSPERRSGVTRTHNGSFNIDLNIENWSETENITEVTEKGYGKYSPEKGIFDECSPTRIDTGYMWDKIDEKYPNLFDDENIINSSSTYSWYGNGLPYVPCIEYFNEGTDLLIITPEHATTLLRKEIENMDKGIYEDTILYKDAMTGLSSDCFDISLNDVDIYVIENDGIMEQSDEEKMQNYNAYKNSVLECIDRGLGLNYKGLVNDDLRMDEDFISRADEILKEYDDEWAKDISQQIGIEETQMQNKDLTLEVEDTESIKDAIDDITKYDEHGYDADGFDEYGRDADGFDALGFDSDGYHKVTNTEYDELGFDCNGIHKVTKTIFDEDGYDQQRYHIDQYGFDEDEYKKFKEDIEKNMKNWNDREFVLNKIKEDVENFKYASEALKTDREVVLEAVKISGFILEYASEELRGDKEVVLEAVKNDGLCLEFASEELRNNKEVVLTALQTGNICDFAILKHVSEDLREDKDVALAGVEQAEDDALEYVSKKLLSDKEFLKQALAHLDIRFAESYIDEELKEDKEFILEALEVNAEVIDLASEELRENKEFMLEAVKVNESAIYSASEELRKNKEFLLEAVDKNVEVLEVVDEDTREKIEDMIEERDFNETVCDYDLDEEDDFDEEDELQELESLRVELRDLREEEKRISETEKLIEIKENQGQNLDD